MFFIAFNSESYLASFPFFAYNVLSGTAILFIRKSAEIYPLPDRKKLVSVIVLQMKAVCIMSRGRSNFKMGTVEMIVLFLLNKKDLYGYQLSALIGRLSGGNVEVSESTLYPTLYKLLKKEYIQDIEVPAGKRRVRVYYHLNDSGRRRLADLLEDYNTLTEGIERIFSCGEIPDDEEERKPGRKPKKAAKAAESAKPTSEPEVTASAAEPVTTTSAAEPVTTTSAAEPDITEPAATENAEPEPEKNEKTAEKTEHQNTETQES